MAAYTGIILVTGEDKPGITQALFETLSPFSVSILDIEQVVIRERLILTALISLDRAHAKAIDHDLSQLGSTLSVDIATSFAESDENSIAAKSGLSYVVALGNPLNPGCVAAVTGAIAELGGNIERIHRTASFPVTAIEYTVSGVPLNRLRKHLALVSSEHGIDVAVSPGGLYRLAKKVVVLDMDSTLIQQEVIELLAAKAGVEERVKEITDRAMRGEIDFAESLSERVALLAGLPQSVIEDVRREITLTPGAKTLVQTLQRLGHTVCVVSGGFVEVIAPLLHELGITLFKANSLEVKDGILTGQLSGEIVDRAGKATALQAFALSEGVDLAQTIAIGDGANDLDMIAAAGFGIAFNAKPAVRAAADSSVTAPYLDSVLYLLGINREDVESAATHEL